jgi:outer membrane protein assembly factor BamD (BamD/ComL family)
MADNKTLAAEFKAKGNAALSAKNYDEAIENYTKVGCCV